MWGRWASETVGCGKALTGGDSCGMKRIKKPLRWGCEGWRPYVCMMPKTNGKQAPPLSFAVTPTEARDARPSHPSPYRKKSRFAKKKSAPPKKKHACRLHSVGYGNNYYYFCDRNRMADFYLNLIRILQIEDDYQFKTNKSRFKTTA